MSELTLTVTQVEKSRILEFLEALRTPCKVHLNSASPLSNAKFESDFLSKLLTYHIFMGSPLFQDSFDSAFISACRSAGHNVVPAPAGQRFWDVIVDGRKISLKSTKMRNLRENKLHISKLTEAAWIQDCRTAIKRRDETFSLFEEYRAEVDAIIQLRYFKSSFTYELVEISVSLFDQIFDVGINLFSADGPTINIPIGKDPPDFTLKIDRSDSKITIANINKELCLVHGTWQIMASEASAT